jgi:hypothetical protein
MDQKIALFEQRVANPEENVTFQQSKGEHTDTMLSVGY